MLPSGPAADASVVTKSDTTLVNARALYIGTAGDVTVDTPTGTNVVFKNVANGTLLPVYVLRVKAATTAADIVALF